MLGRTMLVTVLLAGCGRPADEFRAALPPADALRIAVPGGAVEQAREGLTARSDPLVGQVADFYAVTRRTSEQLNGMVGGVLGTIWGIAQQPPGRMGPDAAVWGPFTPTLSPVTLRLVVARAPQDRMIFHLDARPKQAGDDAFRPFVAGAPEPGTAEGRSAGEFGVNLGLMNALDPVGTPAAGAIGVRWDVGLEGAAIRVHLQDVHGPGEPAATADYAYGASPDGSGDFQFAAHAELAPGAAGPEDLVIHSRWTPSGAGRADASVRNGDAGAGADMSECWNELFARVFFAGAPVGAPGAAEGDPAACVFSDARPPEL